MGSQPVRLSCTRSEVCIVQCVQCLLYKFAECIVLGLYYVLYKVCIMYYTGCVVWILHTNLAFTNNIFFIKNIIKIKIYYHYKNSSPTWRGSIHFLKLYFSVGVNFQLKIANNILFPLDHVKSEFASNFCKKKAYIISHNLKKFFSTLYKI